MADGGYLVKFDGKEIKRCYAASFDFDTNEYKINFDKPKPIPKGVKTITLQIERSKRPSR